MTVAATHEISGLMLRVSCKKRKRQTLHSNNKQWALWCELMQMGLIWESKGQRFLSAGKESFEI